MNHQEHQEEKGGDGVGWEPVDEIDDDLARRIISAAIEVHKTLGPGFLKSIRSEALAHEMNVSGLLVAREKAIQAPTRTFRFPVNDLTSSLKAGSSWD